MLVTETLFVQNLVQELHIFTLKIKLLHNVSTKMFTTDRELALFYVIVLKKDWTEKV